MKKTKLLSTLLTYCERKTACTLRTSRTLVMILVALCTQISYADYHCISKYGIEVKFNVPTRELTIDASSAGPILEHCVVRAGIGGLDISSDNRQLSCAVTIDESMPQMTLLLADKLTVRILIDNKTTVTVRTEGKLQGLAAFHGRTATDKEVTPAILNAQQTKDKHVLFTTLGPADFQNVRSMFYPELDFAMTAEETTDTRWQWENGWHLNTKAPADQDLLKLTICRNYYRDELDIRYYAPLHKRSYWNTAPVVAMTWYGIRGWEAKPAQKKEWLYPNIDWVAEHLLPYAETLIFQLDDNYLFSDDKYMRDISDYIRSKGMIPGIWFTPFTHTAPDQGEQQARQHPKWFLHDSEGKLLENFGGQNWGFIGNCGYVLNVSNPEVASGPYGDFWRKASETWNYDFFKIDGQPPVSVLYSKAADGGGLKGYRSGLEIARKIVGPDKFINSCWGTPTAAIGLVDGSRTGGDTGDDKHAIDVILQWNFLNNLAWWCDPDAAANLYKSPVEPARLNAQARVLTGQQFLTDDIWTKVPQPIRRVWQQSFPMLDIRPVNLYPIKDNWKAYDVFDLRIARPYRTWDVVGLFNYDKKPASKELDLSRLPLEAEEVYVFEYWSSTYLGRFRRDAKITRPMKEYEGQVFSIVPVVDDRPALISTSRHLTQGGLDLEKLSWHKNANNWVVSGRSTHLVAGDDYELLFVPGSYRVKDAARNTSAGDEPLTITPNDNIVRVKYQSPASDNFDWTITFEPKN